ncbi:hypothetical protein [Sphingobacterium daejeonense]|nr:hypothetical protein [Sphingobacterium daejeonense]VTP97195.1 Uncharacterised protein [Sphingobacterium daejeonense]
MENKIISTVKAWIPGCFHDGKEESEYEILQHVAEYCLMNFDGSD